MSDTDEQATATCPVCGKPCKPSELEPAPDPYASEINDDDSPVVKCSDCRYASGLAI